METVSLKIASPAWLVLGVCTTLVFYLLSRANKLVVKLPGPPADKWTTGHFRSLFGISGHAFQEDIIAKYGTTVKLNGAFGEEFIYTIDPAIMHAVLVKDRTTYERPQGATLMFRSAFGGGGLLGMIGEEHRLHRKILTPVFTMKYLRELVRMPIFMGIAQDTCRCIKRDLDATKDSNEVNVFPWMTSAALELIGEAGLGYSFDSFSGHRNGYKLAIRDVMALLAKTRPFTNMLPYVYNLGTPTLRRLVLNYNPIKIVRLFTKAVSVQNNLAEEAISSRQKLISEGVDLSSEPGRGRDLMTLLMKANEAEGAEDHIDRQAMIGHMNVFVFAGHETTSTGISRVLDILAKNPRIQDKLREEVTAYFKEYQDSIDHNELLELPYLDAVIRETLRMHGPVSGIIRANQEDSVLPLEHPIDTPNGPITSIPIKKGTRIVISILMANRYGKTWGERSHEFWPERWIGNKLDEVTEPGAYLPGVYSSMMTFGGGSTSCIGFKFALMELKVMVAALVHKFKFEPPSQETSWAAFVIQLPFIKKEEASPGRLPKLPLKVTEIQPN
ncbi:cytochrome P450 [Ceratobasidium sp. AG-I]|nr:cytochrome P450 [Ceratobasidium sp. AG-I]